MTLTLEEINRILSTESTTELLEWGQKHVIHYYPTRPVVIKEANGVVLKDTDGKEYLDFKGIAMAVTVGHNNKKVIEAMKQQLDQLTTITGDLMNVPQIKLAKLLAELAPGNLRRCYFVCGGSEAVEIAIKTVRRYTKRLHIISRWGGYHGNLGASGVASGTVLYKRDFEPIAPGFIHIPPPYCYRCDFGLKYPDCNIACAKVLESVIAYESPQKIAGVLMEPIIGGGGVVIPPDEYPVEVRRICDKYGIPLIIDEIITGLGRTGKMFCCEHYGISPDIMTLSKTLASTHAPISAILATEEIAKAMEDYTKGFHFTTYNNHPLNCAAALATIKVLIEENLVERSRKLGEYMLKALKEIVEEFDVLDDARGKGLLLGVEVVKSKKTKEPNPDLMKRIVELSFQKGLLIASSHMRMKDATIICFSPPLVVTEEQIDRALDIFRSAVKESIT